MIRFFDRAMADIKLEFGTGYLALFKDCDTYTLVDSQEDGVSIEENVSTAHAMARAIEVYGGRGVSEITNRAGSDVGIDALLGDFMFATGKNLVEYVEEHDWLKARVDLLEKLRGEATGSEAKDIVLALAAMLLPTEEVEKDPDEIWGPQKVDVCVFCGAIMEVAVTEEHKPDCVWRQAKEWAEAHKEN